MSHCIDKRVKATFVKLMLVDWFIINIEGLL